MIDLELSNLRIPIDGRKGLAFLLILILGLAVRLYAWSMDYGAGVSDEGAEYARIAENLLDGKGYLGTIDSGSGPQIVHSPLYPYLIAAMTPITGSSERASVAVAILMGLLLVVPAFFIARQLYGEQAAWIAGLLVAIHPYLVWLSATAYSEATFLTLTMAGVYWGVRSLKPSVHIVAPVLAGAFFGLAYLARPTAVVYPVVTVFSMLAAALFIHRLERSVLRHGAVLLATFSLFALPYVAFQYSVTGQLRFEAKSPVVYTIAERMLSGMTSGEASFGVEHDLAPAGPQLDHTAFVLNELRNGTSHDVVALYREFALENVVRYGKMLFKYSPLALILLALFGIVRAVRTRERNFAEPYLWLLLLASIVPLLALSFGQKRFLATAFPFAILWAAGGAAWLYQQVTTREPFYQWRRLPAGLFLALLVAFVQIPSWSHPVDNPNPHTLDRKQAGRWLRAHYPGEKQVMDLFPLIPYYAGGAWMPFPYAESQVALDYIRKMRPNFLVLDSAEADDRPFLKTWLAQGVPDDTARLIYQERGSTGKTISIYRWSSEETAKPIAHHR